ncbi:hypothetical protein [Sulfurihydrogenibium subterraneum]|uniref:hypothetical protein n=1 Tax=Sulfurihydrogenibium subterraneum TaxID=171121 RepID=UPI000B0F7E2A|nr:hypothetical protein [Sulfurihydrogenibium subterraneum]
MIDLKATLALERFLLSKPVGKDIPLTVGETVKAKVIDVLPSGAVVLSLKDSYLTVNSKLNLEKGQELLLKVLPPKDNKLQLELISLDGKPLKPPEVKIDDLYSNLVKDIETFKNLPEELKNQVVKSLLDSSQISIVNSKFDKTPEINTAIVKKSVENSGIFYENKLYNFFKVISELQENIKEESLKSLLRDLNTQNYKEKINELKMKIEDSATLQKLENLENTIDSIKEDLKFTYQDPKTLEAVKNLQIASLLSNAVYGIFNFNMPNVKFGNFEIKKSQVDGEDAFYFKGSLNFDNGKVDFLVARFKEGYFISIRPESEDLKEKMKIYKNELFKSLNQQGVKVVSLDVY